MCRVEVWRGGLGKAYRLPTLSCVGASLAWGPAGGRGKAARNLARPGRFLQAETEQQVTEVSRVCSGVSKNADH